MLRTVHIDLGQAMILWYDLSNRKQTSDLVHRMLRVTIGQIRLQEQPRNWQDIN